MTTNAQQLSDWVNGTPTGGPNGDGRYPLTYADGTVHLVLCPQAQALANVDDTSAPLQFSQDAQASADAAAASATDAASSATAAATSATNAASSETNAASSATAAASSATDASGSASSAAGSATAADNSATAAATSATNASGSASSAATHDTAAQAAQAAAESARDMAQKWSDNPVGVEVQPGEYSAYHWATQAQASATGALIYRGSFDASSGAFPASPSLGDFYKVGTAGTVSGIDLKVGDQLLYDGTGWDKIDNTESVTSVAGRVGDVTLSIADITSLQSTLDAKASAANAYLSGTVGFQSNGGSASFGPGTGDGASYSLYNVKWKVWWGLGMESYDGVIRGFYDSRVGRWDTLAAPRVNGVDVWHPGNFDPASKMNAANPTLTAGYWTIMPYDATYDDGSTLKAYYNGNTRTLVIGGRDSANGGIAVGMSLGPLAATSVTATSVTVSGNGVWHSGNFNPTTKANATSPTFAGDITLDNGAGIVWPAGAQLRTGTGGGTVSVVQGSSAASAFSIQDYTGANLWTWDSALNLTTTKTLTTGKINLAGASFGSTVAASTIDLSKHIALWGTSYGFCVTGNTLNHVSGTLHNFVTSAAGAPAAVQMGDLTVDCTGSTTATLDILQPGNTSAGSMVSVTSPGGLPGITGNNSGNYRSDIKFGAGQITFAISATSGGAGDNFTFDSSGNFNCTGVASAARIYTGYDSGVVNSVSCSNWFRASGQTGFYCASYGGGWYMTDSTYMRSYQNKAVVASDFVISSDERLKVGIRPFEYKGPLNPLSYTMKANGEKSFGFSAQQVARLYPEAVGVVPETGMMQVSYSKLTTVLSYQINQAEERINSMQVQINALSEMVERLSTPWWRRLFNNITKR